MSHSFRITAACLLPLLIASCAPQNPGINGEGRSRSSAGNAELRGPSANSVIRRSTDQWHADRYYEDSRRHRRR